MMEQPIQLNVKKIEKIVESRETDSLIECVRNLELKATQIAEGDSSTILVAEGTPFERVCKKKIKKFPKMIVNQIDTEHQYQIRARKAGVDTPLPLVSFETAEGDYYLLMERIFGDTVGDIVSKPSLLPEHFDSDAFSKSLKTQVENMHNAGIYHRSLHMYNVMVDRETGLPKILDFGAATDLGSGDDLTYDESVLVLNKTTGKYEQKTGQFEDDNKMVKDLSFAMRKVTLARKSLQKESIML